MLPTSAWTLSIAVSIWFSRLWNMHVTVSSSTGLNSCCSITAVLHRGTYLQANPHLHISTHSVNFSSEVYLFHFAGKDCTHSRFLIISQAVLISKARVMEFKTITKAEQKTNKTPQRPPPPPPPPPPPTHTQNQIPRAVVCRGRMARWRVWSPGWHNAAPWTPWVAPWSPGWAAHSAAPSGCIPPSGLPADSSPACSQWACLQTRPGF